MITGASRGLGRAITLALAAAGADVVLAARSKADLEETACRAAGTGRRALVAPEEIGPLAVYLASAASDFMTGQTLFLDGGQSAA